MLKFYSKHIARGTGVFYIFLFFAVCVRIYFYFSPYSDSSSVLRPNDSYLWGKIVPFLAHKEINIIASLALLALSALYINSANVGATFLRIRSTLPVALCLLFLSCGSYFWILSPLLIIAFLFSYILAILFNSYETDFQKDVSAKVGFYLALASLFEPLLLFYYPVLWISLYILRIFSFKAFLASLLGFWLWYVPLFTLIFFLRDFGAFVASVQPFFQWSSYSLPVLHFDVLQYIVLAMCSFFVLLMIVENSVNSFGEKIKVRLCLTVLTLIEVFSLLFMIFLENTYYIGLTVIFVCFSLHLSHFYSLAKKIKTMLFLFIASVIAAIVLSFVAMH